MVEPRVRRATEDDAEGISAVIAEILKDPEPVALREPLSPEQVVRWMDRLGDNGGLFVCEVEGDVVGFSALDYNTEEPDTATLGVWLLAPHRKKGYGTLLAERALEHAREKGYKRIRGRLPQNNEVALSFLSSIGALVPLYNPEARFELPL
ncbi:MAG TPA: GNAT family N-acetyltransferase [Dehalococcoidia bacterium]|nr:GNAT family N-acetyltransferase [Dehalococcoidia bacterium]